MSPVRGDLLWREQTQTLLRGKLERGRERLQGVKLKAWLALKARWRALVRRAAADIHPWKDKPISATLLKERPYDGFRVENIVFESIPGWKVGLNLFLPPHREGAPRPRPVICPCGHGPKWQDDHQIPPQILARHGFAAALFDMPMFGEKRRDNNHFIQGSQAQMAGIWSNFFFLIDALRVADYLETRRDLDFSRGMGVTGVSGGGYATLFLAQLDKRIRAIAPACCVAPFGAHIIEGLYTGCPENFIRGQAGTGFDFHHLLALAAPMPCLVLGGSQDSLFRQQIVRRSVAEIARIYQLEGAAERLRLFMDDCPHKYTARMANRAALWMRRWLNDDTAGRDLGCGPLLAEKDLDCGTADSTDGILQVTRRTVARLKRNRSTDVSAAAIRRVFGLAAKCPAPRLRPIPRETEWGYPQLRRAVLTSPGDIPLPWIEAEYPSAHPGVAVCFGEDDPFDFLRQNGGLFGLCQRVVAVSLRGFGELEPRPSDYDLYNWCSIDRALADMIFLCGGSAMGQQIGDALRALDAVIARTRNGEIMVVGRGEAALPALFAALLRRRVKRVVLDSFLCGFEALATVPAPRWKRYAYVDRVLTAFDLPDLLRRRTDKRFLLVNACDANKQPLKKPAALRLYGNKSKNLEVRAGLESANLCDLIQQWRTRFMVNGSQASAKRRA